MALKVYCRHYSVAWWWDVPYKSTSCASIPSVVPQAQKCITVVHEVCVGPYSKVSRCAVHTCICTHSASRRSRCNVGGGPGANFAYSSLAGAVICMSHDPMYSQQKDHNTCTWLPQAQPAGPDNRFSFSRKDETDALQHSGCWHLDGALPCQIQRLQQGWSAREQLLSLHTVTMCLRQAAACTGTNSISVTAG